MAIIRTAASLFSSAFVAAAVVSCGSTGTNGAIDGVFESKQTRYRRELREQDERMREEEELRWRRERDLRNPAGSIRRGSRLPSIGSSPLPSDPPPPALPEITDPAPVSPSDLGEERLPGAALPPAASPEGALPADALPPLDGAPPGSRGDEWNVEGAPSPRVPDSNPPLGAVSGPES